MPEIYFRGSIHSQIYIRAVKEEEILKIFASPHQEECFVCDFRITVQFSDFHTLFLGTQCGALEINQGCFH